jgi:two-component sensor histidine kinase
MIESPRILLVDDNPDDRALVRREAEALFPGAHVTEAGSREDFEAAVTGEGYDLIVTDLALRWGHGREVVSAFRQRHPDCAIVMFTGTGDEMTAVELMKSGLDDYVVKSARQLARLRASMKLAVESARHRSALSDRERQLSAALAYKEMVIRELHHRVKNNLQMLTALLELRARMKGPPVAAELQDLAGRLRGLGQVQTRIYEAQTLDRIDFREPLIEMAKELVRAYGEERVRLRLALDEPLQLEVGQAIPLALLTYEVLLNAMKHAWPDGRQGALEIRLQRPDGIPELVIADDGIGYSPESRSTGFGSALTVALAAEATVETSTVSRPGGGTTTRIRFP